MVSVYRPNSSKTSIVSTHGKLLVNELKDPATARSEFVAECVHKDPNCARFKLPESGNNGYHFLVGGNYPKQFILPLLKLFLEVCPEGVRAVNKAGCTPLHLCLTQYHIHPEVIEMLLQVYPQACKVVDNQGLIPLFLCVMRDDISADICKAICKANPEGPTARNRTGSFPLHFAAKRARPNKDILRILLRRNPSAAMVKNDFGLLPLHCLSVMSDDVTAAEMIYQAAPEAVQEPDRQGRTCLHLAVLSTGKEHAQAVVKEEEEILMEAMQKQQQQQQQHIHGRSSESAHKAVTRNSNSNNDNDDDDDDNDADCDVDDENNTTSITRSLQSQLKISDSVVEREGSRSRDLVRYLISVWPKALVTVNNFQATPVETVLEKTRPQRSKKKVVNVYGLYDDPPTARLLLTAQRNRSPSWLRKHPPRTEATGTFTTTTTTKCTTTTTTTTSAKCPDSSAITATTVATGTLYPPASIPTGSSSSSAGSSSSSSSSSSTSSSSTTSSGSSSSTVPLLLPDLRPRHWSALLDLNWVARKEALYASLVVDPRYSEVIKSDAKSNTTSTSAGVFYRLVLNHDANKTAKKSTGKNSHNKTSGGRKQTMTTSGTTTTSTSSCNYNSNNSYGLSLTNVNILAKLREHGFNELLHIIVSYM